MACENVGNSCLPLVQCQEKNKSINMTYLLKRSKSVWSHNTNYKMSPSPPICELWQHDTWLEKLMIIIESSHEEASKMFPLNCQLPYLIGQQAFHYGMWRSQSQFTYLQTKPPPTTHCTRQIVTNYLPLGDIWPLSLSIPYHLNLSPATYR